MTLIADSRELAEICSRLARHPFVTVDTEFLRETTFWPKVCVIQLASPDEAVAVDALAEGLDMQPFFTLMADPNVVKVFHAARQDIEIVWNLARMIPAPLFDTQVAAMVCGYGDQVSYGDLVQQVCRVALDKSSRFTDWSKRPLSDAQVNYAIADVTYLRDIYLFLKSKLESSGRIEWLADEMATLTSVSTYEQKPENAWERMKGRARKPRDLAVLMEVAAWREHEAQTRDVPRSRVLKDDVLIEIAQAAPSVSNVRVQAPAPLAPVEAPALKSFASPSQTKSLEAPSALSQPLAPLAPVPAARIEREFATPEFAKPSDVAVSVPPTIEKIAAPKVEKEFAQSREYARAEPERAAEAAKPAHSSAPPREANTQTAPAASGESAVVSPRADPRLPTFGVSPPAALPKTDLDSIKERARQIAREGTGPRTAIPFFTAPPPPKKEIEKAFDKALKRPECKDAYAEMGLAAVIPLIRDAVTEKGCKW